MSDNPFLRGPRYQIKADFGERRQRSENHYCWHCDLGDEMLAEIERLRSLADEMGRVNIEDQKEIMRLKAALGMCPVTNGKHVWAIYPIGQDGNIYRGPLDSGSLAAGAFCQLCQIPKSPYHDALE
jgi:hypothetical protein